MRSVTVSILILFSLFLSSGSASNAVAAAKGDAAGAQGAVNSSKELKSTDESSSSEKSVIDSLRDAFAVISNPTIDLAVKSEVVDSLFQNIDGLCRASCDVPLRTLRTFNRLIGAESITEMIGNWREKDEKLVALSPEDMDEASERVGSLMRSQDSKTLQNRLSSSIELMRYVISLREQEFFAASSNPRTMPQMREILRNDLARLTRQLRSIYEIWSILSDKDRSQSGGKIALNDEEARRIVMAVSQMDMIVYDKLMQTMSSNSLLFGAEARSLIKNLQENLPKIPADVVNQIIREDLGRDPSELFIGFDASQPMASATIGQTYRVKVKTAWGGLRDMIVKVQRPGLRDSLNRSRAVNQVLFKIAGIVRGSGENDQALDLIASQVLAMENVIEHEIDLQNEFKQLERARALLALNYGVRIPKPIRRLSSARVLTMEVLPGESIDQLLSDVQKHDRQSLRKIYARVFSSYLYQLTMLGEIHGDMNVGNVLATPRGNIGLIDWAYVFRSRGLITPPIQLLYALLTGNSNEFARIVTKLNVGPSFQATRLPGKVREVFNEQKIHERSVITLATRGSQVSPEQMKQALIQINEKANDLGFRLNPKYLQMIRTSLPAFGVLSEIGHHLNEKDQNRIMAAQAIWWLPGGLFKAMGGRLLELLTRPQRKIAELLTSYGRTHSLKRQASLEGAAKAETFKTCQDLFL